MTENKNRYITVAYKLYSDNEKGIHEIFEEAPEEHPFQFITGLSAALPAFEAQVAELNAGDCFDFTLSVEEAFGPYEQEHVPHRRTFRQNTNLSRRHLALGQRRGHAL